MDSVTDSALPKSSTDVTENRLSFSPVDTSISAGGVNRTRQNALFVATLRSSRQKIHKTFTRPHSTVNYIGCGTLEGTIPLTGYQPLS